MPVLDPGLALEEAASGGLLDGRRSPGGHYRLARRLGASRSAAMDSAAGCGARGAA